MPDSKHRWMLPVAYLAFALAFGLAVLQVLQWTTELRLLDDPGTGATILGLLGLILHGVAPPRALTHTC